MDATTVLVCYAQGDAHAAWARARRLVGWMERHENVGVRGYYLTMALEAQADAARMSAVARRLLGIVE